MRANDIKDAIEPVENFLLIDRYSLVLAYAARKADLDAFDEGESTSEGLTVLIVNGDGIYGAFHGFSYQASGSLC